MSNDLEPLKTPLPARRRASSDEKALNQLASVTMMKILAARPDWKQNSVITDAYSQALAEAIYLAGDTEDDTDKARELIEALGHLRTGLPGACRHLPTVYDVRVLSDQIRERMHRYDRPARLEPEPDPRGFGSEEERRHFVGQMLGRKVEPGRASKPVASAQHTDFRNEYRAILKAAGDGAEDIPPHLQTNWLSKGGQS